MRWVDNGETSVERVRRERGMVMERSMQGGRRWRWRWEAARQVCAGDERDRETEMMRGKGG